MIVGSCLPCLVLITRRSPWPARVALQLAVLGAAVAALVVIQKVTAAEVLAATALVNAAALYAHGL